MVLPATEGLIGSYTELFLLLVYAQMPICSVEFDWILLYKDIGVTRDLDAVAKRIIELQIEHRDLDRAIEQLQALGTPGIADELHLRRLKKRKLQLKDQITWLQIQLTPDIPA